MPKTYGNKKGASFIVEQILTFASRTKLVRQVKLTFVYKTVS